MKYFTKQIQNDQGIAGIKGLLTLAILAAAIYFGIQLFIVYDHNWTLEEHIKELIEFAFVNLSGDREQQLFNQIAAMLDEMGAQYEKQNVRIKVDERNKEITIDVWYAQVVHIPFFPNPKQFYVHMQSGSNLG